MRKKTGLIWGTVADIWRFLGDHTEDSASARRKMLLIQPTTYDVNMAKFPPLSIITLASLTPEKDFDIELIHEPYQKIDYNKKYDIIGITVQTILSKRAYQIADRFRRRGNRVILGGTHPTFMPEEAERHCDSLVIGEAEEIWNEVLDDIKADQLKKRYTGGHIDMKNCARLRPKYFKN